MPDCPTSVTDDSILMEAPLEGEIRDQTYSFYWTEPGSTVEPESIVDECESTGFATDLMLCRTDSLIEVVSLVTGETVTTIASELMPDGVFGYGSSSPDGRYVALSFLNQPGAESGRPGRSPVVIDLDSGAITDLEGFNGPFTHLSWISDTQLTVLNEEPTPGCADCPWMLTVVDVTDFSRLFQLLLPESSSETTLRLQR